MKREYLRYGVPGFRRWVGGLQIAGSLGLLAGLMLPLIGHLAAGGLALLMFCGICLRRHIKDRLVQTFPAIFYLILNAYLAIPGLR